MKPLLFPIFLDSIIYSEFLILYTSFLITLVNAGQCVIAVATITPLAPFPTAKEIKIIKIICGIPMNISTTHIIILSVFLFPIAARIPKTIAINTPMPAPIIPTYKEKCKPFMVLTNISLPIESVPNKKFVEGDKFFKREFVSSPFSPRATFNIKISPIKKIEKIMDVTTLILASIFILPSLNSDSKYYLIYPLLYCQEKQKQ